MRGLETFTGPAKCMSVHDCDKHAKWVLSISLWAKGMPKSSHDPIKMMFGLKVCDQHQYVVTPATFWVQETKDLILHLVRGQGKADPDFDTAEFSWVPLGVLP